MSWGGHFCGPQNPPYPRDVRLFCAYPSLILCLSWGGHFCGPQNPPYPRDVRLFCAYPSLILCLSWGGHFCGPQNPPSPCDVGLFCAYPVLVLGRSFLRPPRIHRPLVMLASSVLILRLSCACPGVVIFAAPRILRTLVISLSPHNIAFSMCFRQVFMVIGGWATRAGELC